MLKSLNRIGAISSIVLLAGCLGEAQSQSTTEMVTIPAGPFIMGTNTGPAEEQPAHAVELATFEIDRTPVTKAQFARFLEAVGPVSPGGETYYQDDDSDARIDRSGSSWLAEPGFEDHPVLEVSWAGARDYCAWANKRLPTEAKWEKAARGSEGRMYPWGNQAPDRTRAQFDGGWRETARVGGLPEGASPYGVLDMAGNVWEWVSSAYAPYPYDALDGRESLEPGPVRGTRGGGQDTPARQIRSTERGRNLSREFDSGHHNIGFRCAR